MIDGKLSGDPKFDDVISTDLCANENLTNEQIDIILSEDFIENNNIRYLLYYNGNKLTEENINTLLDKCGDFINVECSIDFYKNIDFNKLSEEGIKNVLYYYEYSDEKASLAVNPTITDDIWVPEDMYNQVINNPEPPVFEEVFIPECIPTEDDYVILNRALIVKEKPEVNFMFFVNEIQKGLQLKATRGREDVAGVVKAVWNKYKGEFVSDIDKAASKQFCIEVHASFNQLMDEQPRHWFFISVAVYVNGYFQEAIARCTP